MTTTVRDHGDIYHTIDIPEGWYEVHSWHPPAMIGDRFLDINYLWINGGERWVELLTEGDLALAPRVVEPSGRLSPGIYGCLIRKKPGPEVYQAANI